ncbi:MAG: radical SAM protein [Saprospiraceae bacterium]
MKKWNALVQAGCGHGHSRKGKITGGEPFVRKDMIEFLERLGQIPGLSLNLTTNGTLTHQYIDRQNLGISSVNLSLDTIDRQRFFEITRRDELPNVMQTFQALLDAEIQVKVNAVVMKDKNIEDLVPLVELGGKMRLVEVRFIEEMPFNGEGAHYASLEWNHLKILDFLSNHFQGIQKMDDGPAKKWKIPGFKGNFGIIAAYSRTFCGTCDRIRVTPVGSLKTCLYDEGVFNIKDLMRAGASDEQLKMSLLDAIVQKMDTKPKKED